jgi:hypothetical protein
LDRVHQQEIGRLAGRLREQAHSYNWIGYISKKLVGCQAAFASRLAPTVLTCVQPKRQSRPTPQDER